MGDKKENDFWQSSSNDDFWNKPVVDESWIKNDSGKLGDDFWNTDSTEDYSGLSKEFLRNEKPRQNPYLEKETEWQEQKKEPIDRDDKGEKKKKVHVRTIICLIAMLIALLGIVTAPVLIRAEKKRAFAAVSDNRFRQEEVSNIFQYNQNNKVFLENEAYTIVAQENFQGFPEGLKLIAAYVTVESDQYIRDSYAMRDIYIGYEEDGMEAFKKPARSDMAMPYLYGFGFRDEQLLGTYGIGNGSNCSGFYFFFVPDHVNHITLYMERKKTVDKIQVIATLYAKEMSVLPPDNSLTAELSEREAD